MGDAMRGDAMRGETDEEAERLRGVGRISSVRDCESRPRVEEPAIGGSKWCCLDGSSGCCGGFCRDDCTCVLGACIDGGCAGCILSSVG